MSPTSLSTKRFQRPHVDIFCIRVAMKERTIKYKHLSYIIYMSSLLPDCCLTVTLALRLVFLKQVKQARKRQNYYLKDVSSYHHILWHLNSFLLSGIHTCTYVQNMSLSS